MASYPPRITLNDIEATANYITTPDFTIAQELAGARAMLRQGVCNDNQHLKTRTKNGLQRMFVELHNRMGLTKKELQTFDEELELAIDASNNDLFDADRIDGGITVMMRIPGYSTQPIQTNDFTVDVYVPPREIIEGGEKFTEHVALMVQTFGEQIAIPYLHRFREHCHNEAIKAPNLAPMSSPGMVYHYGYLVLHSYHPRLPPTVHISVAAVVPVVSSGTGKTSQYIGCHQDPLGQSPSSLTAITKLKPKLAVASLVLPKSVAEPLLIRGFSPYPFPTIKAIYHIAEPDSPLVLKELTVPPGPQKVILSIGPNTDTILDVFELPDSLIPRLQVLMSTTRSTRWESALSGPEWGLTPKQASNVS
ncbi:hypothetical protein BD779DRAFT_1474828 [Infundibulicybe gibba]|nr:hypothetical protein BD779DRAFT_1474828 [Infundibulicybe gibba]